MTETTVATGDSQRLGLKRGHKAPTAKSKDPVGAEAKASAVGGLCSPGS
jgi:hypothetical protein